MSGEDNGIKSTAPAFETGLRPAARLKANIADRSTFEAMHMLQEAGCAVTTVLVTGQPYPEVLLNGTYYRGIDEIRTAVSGLRRQ
jgi:hypothetical protein